MRKAYLAIGITTFYLMVYAMMPSLGAAYDLMFAVFVGGNILVLYMVYAILKHMQEPKEKWSEGYWYSDVNKKFSEDA
jgi:hypothetical protein